MKALFFIFLLILATVEITAQNKPAEQQTSMPLSLGIVVDNSGSYRTIFDRVVSSTNSVIQDVRPGDEAFFVTFVNTPKIVLRQEMTREKQDLRDASDNMFIEGGPTAILDAVVFAAKYMAEHASPDNERARVLILITDGDERESGASIEEAVKIAKEAKIRIFVLGLHEEKFYTKVVDRLTRETGGAKFVPKFPKDTATAVSSLLTAIRAK